jgi:hypothetical protein
MTLSDLKRVLRNVPVSRGEPLEPVLVLIQLPDDEPPVSFTVDLDYLRDGVVILFPKPPQDGAVWHHATNLNDYGPAQDQEASR